MLPPLYVLAHAADYLRLFAAADWLHVPRGARRFCCPCCWHEQLHTPSHLQQLTGCNQIPKGTRCISLYDDAAPSSAGMGSCTPQAVCRCSTTCLMMAVCLEPSLPAPEAPVSQVQAT